MSTTTIAIEVDPDSARSYAVATEDQKRQVRDLLQCWLSMLGRPVRPIEVIEQDLAAQAQARGLTPRVVDEILNY